MPDGLRPTKLVAAPGESERLPRTDGALVSQLLFVRFDHQRKELVRQFLGWRVLLPQDHADLLLNFAVRRRPQRLRLRVL
jgi:hypothetical protein